METNPDMHQRNRFTLFSFTLAVSALGFMTACSVGPNYKRPAVSVPANYRGATEEVAPAAATSPSPEAPPKSSSSISLGDEKWWEVFEDKELQQLISTALKNNYDVRIAATRVLQAQAQLGIIRADQFPSLTAGGNVTSVRNPAVGPIPAYELTQGEVTATAGWNIDFWGRYRRATEGARANLLANEWAQKAVMSSLVANV